MNHVCKPYWLLIFLLCCTNINAQILLDESYHLGNGGLEYYGRLVMQSNDNGFLLAGGHAYYSPGAIFFEGSYAGMTLVKTDALGTQQWTQDFGGQSLARAMYQRNSDGAFVIAAGNPGTQNCGEPQIGGIEPSNFSLLIVSENDGSTLSHSILEAECGHRFLDAMVYNNDGFIILTRARNFFTNESAYYLKRYDENANLLWSHSYDVPATLQKIVLMADGTIVAAGKLLVDPVVDNNQLFWMRIDEAGTVLNEITLDDTRTHKGVHQVLSPAVGQLLVLSYNQTVNESYVTKVDVYGNMSWQETFSGIVQDAVAGHNGSHFLAFQNELYQDNVNSNITVYKIDNNGNTYWNKVYDRGYDDRVSNIILCNDRTFALTGTINCCNQDTPGAAEIYLVKDADFRRGRARVLLGGAKLPGLASMHTELCENNLLPLAQPFSGAPWYYSGNEALEDATAMPTNTVEWVLVELRDASDRSVLVEQRAALLLDDGSILDPNDLTDGLCFYNTQDDAEYYMAIRNRNHLPVLSANTIAFPNDLWYDFTQAANVEGAEEQLEDTDVAGVYTMVQGDFDGNGIITVDDFNIYRSQIAALHSYEQGDLDGDGNVTVTDYNRFLPNASRIAVGPLRY